MIDKYGSVVETEMFVDVSRGLAENPCAPANALAALRVAEACDLSRREQRAVELQEVAA